MENNFTYIDFYNKIAPLFMCAYDMYIRESIEHIIFMNDMLGHDDQTRQENFRDVHNLRRINDKLFKEKREETKELLHAWGAEFKSLKKIAVDIEPDHFLLASLDDYVDLALEEKISDLMKYDLECISNGAIALLSEDCDNIPFPYFVTRENLNHPKYRATKMSFDLFEELHSEDEENYKQLVEMTKKVLQTKVKMMKNSLIRVFHINNKDVSIEDIKTYIDIIDNLWV